MAIEHDIVIVGGGGAGLRAAIAIAELEPNLSVACVSKVYPMRSHTVAAEGGAAAVIKSNDSLEDHINDGGVTPIFVRGVKVRDDALVISRSAEIFPLEDHHILATQAPAAKGNKGDGKGKAGKGGAVAGGGGGLRPGI